MHRVLVFLKAKLISFFLFQSNLVLDNLLFHTWTFLFRWLFMIPLSRLFTLDYRTEIWQFSFQLLLLNEIKQTKPRDISLHSKPWKAQITASKFRKSLKVNHNCCEMLANQFSSTKKYKFKRPNQYYVKLITLRKIKSLENLFAKFLDQTLKFINFRQANEQKIANNIFFQINA